MRQLSLRTVEVVASAETKDSPGAKIMLDLGILEHVEISSQDSLSMVDEWGANRGQIVNHSPADEPWSCLSAHLQYSTAHCSCA
jgi:hypothetical protein